MSYYIVYQTIITRKLVENENIEDHLYGHSEKSALKRYQ